MTGRIMMLPHDVVLTADQHARGTFKPIRLRRLSAGNLDEEVGPVVRRDSFLSDDMVETEIEFIEGEHLRDRGLSMNISST